jgi:single-strand DNA-binding protein
MTDTISITGLVATTPKHVVTATGLSITSFRFASTQRRYDRAEGKWVDGDTNWYTVATFRQLAINVVASIQKGQRIIITGRLRVRDWANDDKHGTNVEIDADAVGHDLSWGTTVFTRSTATAMAEAEGAGDEEPGTGDAGGDADGADADEDDLDDAEPRRQEPVGSALPF